MKLEISINKKCYRGWVGGCKDVKAFLRTADSNQNYISYLQ
jgi:hypothetical protein